MFRKKSKIYKKAFSLLFILFLIIFSLSSVPPIPPAQEASAQAVVNLANSSSGGTAVITAVSGTPSGSAGNTVDENAGTYYRSSKAGNTCCNPERDINCIVSFTEEITLASLSTVNIIEYDLYFEPVSFGGTTPYDRWGIIKEADVFIYQAGTWIQVVNNTSADGNVSGPPWLNVEKIRFTISTNAWTNCISACGYGCLDGVPAVIAQLNELKIWGFPNYQDIGLKMQTPSGIVPIAAENGTATSPLRIAKDGIVYGIVLVNPGDANDSGVRIQLASGETKALRKL